MKSRATQFTLLEVNSSGPTLNRSFDANELVEVIDIALNVTVTLKAREVSPYRHHLRCEGRVFRILSVTDAMQ